MLNALSQLCLLVEPGCGDVCHLCYGIEVDRPPFVQQAADPFFGSLQRLLVPELGTLAQPVDIAFMRHGQSPPQHPPGPQ